MEILNLRALDVGYLVNGIITVLPTNADYAQVMEWVNEGKEVIPKYTQADLYAISEAKKHKEVTKLQMQKAMRELVLWDDFKLLRASNIELEDYWSDALNVYRYDPMVLSMGKTDIELDALFLLASTK